MRRDYRSPFLSDGNLRQQARIGRREAVQIAGPAHRQRPADESLLVDDLCVAQLLLGPHDVIDRIELVLQLNLLAAEVLDFGAADGHFLRKALDFDAHLRQPFTQPVHLGRLLPELRVHVGDHLFQALDTQVGLAQQGCRTLQRSDFVFILPQQAVDGRDVVVDLLHGAASSLSLAGHGDEILARLDQREVLRNGVDVREHGVDERILGADDRHQRIALALGLDDDLPSDARRKGCCGA